MEGSPLAKDFESISLINTSLKRVQSDLQITLPNIAVVGVVLIGKSSLIEQLTDLAFLPRYVTGS
jgi:GTP-binding protein EngB required for normal cell division